MMEAWARLTSSLFSVNTHTVNPSLREPNLPGFFWANAPDVCDPECERVVRILTVQLLADASWHEHRHRCQLLGCQLVRSDRNLRTRPRIHDIAHVRALPFVSFAASRDRGSAPVSARSRRAIIRRGRTNFDGVRLLARQCVGMQYLPLAR